MLALMRDLSLRPISYEADTSSQAAHNKHQAAMEDLRKAAREIAEMHELLMVHKQRIPTVDMVQT